MSLNVPPGVAGSKQGWTGEEVARVASLRTAATGRKLGLPKPWVDLN